MKKVYVIIGHKTGEAPDREWPVVAYLDEALARSHVEQAQAHVAYNGHPGIFDPAWATTLPSIVERYGLQYAYVAVELRDEMPREAEAGRA